MKCAQILKLSLLGIGVQLHLTFAHWSDQPQRKAHCAGVANEKSQSAPQKRTLRGSARAIGNDCADRLPDSFRGAWIRFAFQDDYGLYPQGHRAIRICIGRRWRQTMARDKRAPLRALFSRGGDGEERVLFELLVGEDGSAGLIAEGYHKALFAEVSTGQSLARARFVEAGDEVIGAGVEFAEP